MSDNLVRDLREGQMSFHDARVKMDAAATALSEARAEIERLRAELDASNANHRQMATTMANLARKHDALRARVQEVVGPLSGGVMSTDEQRAIHQLLEAVKP